MAQQQITLETILSIEHLISVGMSETLKQSLLSEFGVTEEEIKFRMGGIYKEYDLILALHLLNVCKTITPLDEKYASVFDVFSSDVLIKLKNGKQFLLEIKSTHNDTYSISKQNLQKRIDYASEHNLDLYFAVCLSNSLWMVFKSDYLLRKEGKITLGDYNESELPNLFNVRTFMFKNYEFRSIFSKDGNNAIEGLSFDPYGQLVSEEFFWNDKRIYKVKNHENDKSKLSYVLFLEGLKDRAANDKQIIETIDANLTKIIEKGNNQIISEIDLLLSPIRHRSENNFRSAKEYLDYLKENKINYEFDVKTLRSIFKSLKITPIDIVSNKIDK